MKHQRAKEAIFLPTKESLPPQEGLRIRILPSVFERLVALIEACPDEISGFGKTEELPDGILVTDLVVLPQEGWSAHTDISSEAMAAFIAELMSRKEQPLDWRLWWHSHVYFGAQFSLEDDRTARDLIKAKDGWVVSLVGNKFRQFGVRYDRKNAGGRHEVIGPLPLELAVGFDSAAMAAAEKEIAEKVRVVEPLIAGRKGIGAHRAERFRARGKSDLDMAVDLGGKNITDKKEPEQDSAEGEKEKKEETEVRGA